MGICMYDMTWMVQSERAVRHFWRDGTFSLSRRSCRCSWWWPSSWPWLLAMVAVAAMAEAAVVRDIESLVDWLVAVRIVSIIVEDDVCLFEFVG